MAQSEGETTWTQWDDEEAGTKNMTAGAIFASALAAGVIAYLLRRARQEQEEEARTPAGLASRALERTRDAVDVEAGREFLVKKVLPEFKPALLSILEEVEDAVDKAFRRAEKAIKNL
jgi:hypothetical protein